MQDMPRKLDKHVYRERTRHGNVVFYYRIGQGPRTRLPDPTSPEYEEAYQSARNGIELAKPKAYGTNSIAWLMRQYVNSNSFAEYSPTTRKQRSYIYAEIEQSFGKEAYAGITRKTIISGRERRLDRPNQARMFLDAMRCLFAWAKENELVKVDPTEGIKNPKRTNKIGFEPWTSEDVEKFEAMYPEGTKERVWLHVLLYTGLRKGDAVKVGKQHIKDNLLSLTTEKTTTRIYRVIHPQLAKTLEAGPIGDLHFIVGTTGKPLNKDSFGNSFRKAAQKAGIFKPMHGIRKLAATMAAEKGLSVAELEALFGWTGGGMAQHYTKSANQKRLALSAEEKMQNKEIPHPDSEIPHLKNNN